MPPNPQQSQGTEEQYNPELENKFTASLERKTTLEVQGKGLKIDTWMSRDKLIHDYFTFTLLTIAAAITVFTAQSDFIKSKSLFTFALVTLALIVVFASIARIYFSQISSSTNDVVFNELKRKLEALDWYRINPTNITRERLMTILGSESLDLDKKENWLVRNAHFVVVILYAIAALSLALSLLFTISL